MLLKLENLSSLQLKLSTLICGMDQTSGGMVIGVVWTGAFGGGNKLELKHGKSRQNAHIVALLYHEELKHFSTHH